MSELATATAAPLLDVRGLRVESRIDGRARTIVERLDLTLAPGETVGIVGESGSGKSLSARAIMGLLPAGVFASGTVLHGGRNLLELGRRERSRLHGSEIGLIMQDPFTMLNPLLRCGRHVDELLRTPAGRRLSKEQRRAEARRRLAEVGIHDPSVIDRYPFQLSGGMRQRVGIAAALARDPRILIADEPSTALDVTTQAEALALLRSLQESRGMGLILITHDLRVAFSVCDRILVLYAGSVLEVAPGRALEREPLHPYSLGLLMSEPPADRRLARLEGIEGSVPKPEEVAGRCPFMPRCRWAAPVCGEGRPPLVTLAAERSTACARIEQIRDEMAALRGSAVASAADVAVPHEQRRPLVRARDVCKVYASGGVTVEALRGVAIDLGEHESVGIVGESGSGKTTLGRCLVGLETATSGEIEIDGMPAGDYDALRERERRQLHRTLQIVFQDPYSSLNPRRTIGAALAEAVVAGDARARNVSATVEQLPERVGLPAAYAPRKPVALSGGERQRVAIARALAVRPKAIVCDEAVSALDVSVQAQILNLFASLREELGMSYLFITHDLAVVRQITERVYVMHRGEVVEEGPVGTVLDSPSHPYTRRLVQSVPHGGREA